MSIKSNKSLNLFTERLTEYINKKEDELEHQKKIREEIKKLELLIATAKDNYKNLINIDLDTLRNALTPYISPSEIPTYLNILNNAQGLKSLMDKYPQSYSQFVKSDEEIKKMYSILKNIYEDNKKRIIDNKKISYIEATIKEYNYIMDNTDEDSILFPITKIDDFMGILTDLKLPLEDQEEILFNILKNNNNNILGIHAFKEDKNYKYNLDELVTDKYKENEDSSDLPDKEKNTDNISDIEDIDNELVTEELKEDENFSDLSDEEKNNDEISDIEYTTNFFALFDEENIDNESANEKKSEASESSEDKKEEIDLSKFLTLDDNEILLEKSIKIEEESIEDNIGLDENTKKDLYKSVRSAIDYTFENLKGQDKQKIEYLRNIGKIIHSGNEERIKRIPEEINKDFASLIFVTYEMDDLMTKIYDVSEFSFLPNDLYSDINIDNINTLNLLYNEYLLYSTRLGLTEEETLSSGGSYDK